MRAVASNVGQALHRAMRGIEKVNPETFYGIFGDAQWTNKERLSDAMLRDLVEHFSRINLGNQAAQADETAARSREPHSHDRLRSGERLASAAARTAFCAVGCMPS